MFLHTWRALCGWLACCCVLAAVPAHAQVTDPDLAKALAYYERGDFQRAAADLPALVENPRLTPDERVRAREALGVSYYVLGRLLDARREFGALLAADPDYQPDPLYVAPEIVAFVADIRRGRLAGAVTAPAAPNGVTAPAKTGPPPPLLEPVTASLSPIDFVPFGAAQFRRGETGRGVTLAVLEGAFLATNVGLYYYRRCSLKPCDDPYYAAGDVGRARHLQTYQMIAGSLFIATAVLGVADGISLPVAERQSIRIRPAAAGLAIAWESK